MKHGDSFDCPHCGKNTFVIRESVLSGWKKTGEVLKCAACSAVIETVKEQANTPAPAFQTKSSADKLKNLLGGDAEIERPKVTVSSDEKKFCRDCAHLIAHPFLSRCTKFNKEVNPMDDCPHFLPRNTGEDKK